MLQHSNEVNTMNKSLRNNSIKSLRNGAIISLILTGISFEIMADDFFGGDTFFDTPSADSGDNSFYKSDGSLVIINGAKESGLIVKGTDSGMEQEYYVIPKDDGSKTFIYDSELLVCDNNGCY